ncbi:MAG: Hpt domain-containing protein, partial [Chromatiales bacterium]
GMLRAAYAYCGLPAFVSLSMAGSVCANRSNSPPIVALTADVVPETRNEVIAAGMDGYLLKPHTESQLLNVILPLLRGEKPQLAQVMATANESVDSDADLPIRDKEKALIIAGGNTKLVDEMFNQFCNELPEQAGVIRGNHAARQGDDLRENVHRLHGATSICGVPALNLAVTHLEAACKSRDEAKTLEKLQRFNHEVERLLDFSTQELHSD